MTKPIMMKKVQLHTPFHLAGTSFQTALDIYESRHKGQIKLEYHAPYELHVHYKGHLAILPSSNVASMVVDDGNPMDRGGPSSSLPDPYAVAFADKLTNQDRLTGRKLPDPPPPAVAAASAEVDTHFATSTTPVLSDYEAARGDPAGQVFAGPGAVPVKAPRYTRKNT